MDPDDYMIGAGQAVEAKHLEKGGVRVAPSQAVTYVIAGARELSRQFRSSLSENAGLNKEVKNRIIYFYPIVRLYEFKRFWDGIQ